MHKIHYCPTLSKEEVYRRIVYDYNKCIENNVNYSTEVDGIHFILQSTTKLRRYDTKEECIDSA
jgi:hypothetical protein